MILITIILIIVGALFYAVIGSLVVKTLDNNFFIEIDKDGHPDGYSIFILGLFFPIVLFYVLVKEISEYLFNQFYE
jgi:hypothetical protein